jgi:hypothetical protein
MKRFLASIILVLCVTSAVQAASSPNPVIAAKLMVKGTITVGTDGHVAGYALEQPGKLPKVVVQMLDKTIPDWTFVPVKVDGHPARVRAKMHLMLIATPQPDKRYSIRIDGSSFNRSTGSSDENLRYTGHRTPPHYPRSARMNGVSGTVYLVLRVNRQGRVDKLAAEHVDLMIKGSARQMKRWRDSLADASMKAARTWHFKVPTKGPQAHAGHWFALIPVTFKLAGRFRYAYGDWQLFIPGPHQYIPWVDRAELARDTALPDGSIQTLGHPGLHRVDKPSG